MEYAEFLLNDDRKTIQETLREKGMSKTDFTPRQMDEILLGDAHGVDYTLYAKKEYDATKMRQIREGLEEAAKEESAEKLTQTKVMRYLKIYLKVMQLSVDTGLITLPVLMDMVSKTFLSNDKDKQAFLAALPAAFKEEVRDEVEMENIRSDVEQYCKDHDSDCSKELADAVAVKWVKEGKYDCNLDYWENISYLIESCLKTVSAVSEELDSKDETELDLD